MMRKIIPFEKEIAFDTPINEITSISLEHTLSLEDDNVISGDFHINGEYKISEVSTIKEKYDYHLPFYIALDARYDVKNTKIDIDNFYYKVTNGKLRVNIDVYIDGLVKEEEAPLEERCYDLQDIPIIEEKKKEVNVMNEVKSEEKDLPAKEIEVEVESPTTKVEVPLEKIESFIDERKNDMDKVLEEMLQNSDKKSFFDSLDGNETYSSYYVYIVKEEDNIDKILTKYNISKEDLASYNDISNIKVGDKLIIPEVKNEQ